MIKGYKLSRDYKRLKELLDKGYEVVCFTTYDAFHWHRDEPNYEPFIVTDVCRARKDGECYHIGARGIEYTSYWPKMRRFESFEEACEDSNIEFIEPEVE